MDNIKLLENLQNKKKELFQEIKKVIIGQDKIVEEIFISLLCNGHVLVEGVPGLAKTLLIKTLATALNLNFNRIQFTPDLMPSDIIGTDIIEEDSKTGERKFKFLEGPIFTNILLADEINRTPPKTQSALLQAMEEKNVTVGGKTLVIDNPFFVLATQNPIEQEGTYPLPEAQLDRFMFNLIINYPKKDEEIQITQTYTEEQTTKINQIIDYDELIAFQNLVLKVPVSENIINSAVKLVRSTRPGKKSNNITNEFLLWGSGPRASMYLILAAKAKALISGKSSPDLEDLLSIVKPVMRHRIIASFNAEAKGKNKDQIIEDLIKYNFE